jgi:hypothetical protein
VHSTTRFHRFLRSFPLAGAADDLPSRGPAGPPLRLDPEARRPGIHQKRCGAVKAAAGSGGRDRRVVAIPRVEPEERALRSSRNGRRPSAVYSAVAAVRRVHPLRSAAACGLRRRGEMHDENKPGREESRLRPSDVNHDVSISCRCCSLEAVDRVERRSGGFREGLDASLVRSGFSRSSRPSCATPRLAPAPGHVPIRTMARVQSRDQESRFRLVARSRALGDRPVRSLAATGSTRWTAVAPAFPGMWNRSSGVGVRLGGADEDDLSAHKGQRCLDASFWPPRS